jgi:hypothetical protein
MNRKFFSLVILSLMLLPSSRAALTFSVVPFGTNTVLGTNFSGFMNAIALGQANLAAVGSNSAVLTVTNLSNGDLFTRNGVWTTNGVGQNLRAVAYGAGFFVASGSNNVIFTWTNGAIWTTNNRALGSGSTFEARGLSYNGTNFVLAPSTVDIRYSGTNTIGAPAWPDGNNSNVAFLESYRAVAPYGTNGFALCGGNGVVRYSTNGGVTWWPSHPYDFGDTNYLGIATDGNSNIVAVGEGGAIKYCTNGGFSTNNSNWTFASTNWQTSLSNLLNLKASMQLNVNAITFAGANGFIAAGSCKSSGNDFGFIITSTDGGATWTPQTNFLWNQVSTISLLTNAPQTNMYSLYKANALVLTNRIMLGAAFGLNTNSSYLFQNLAVLVGENGTVIIGGQIPDAPTNPISQTNYAGFASTNLLVSVPPLITADWYWQSPSGSNVLVGVGVTNFIPPPIANWLSNTIYTSNYVVFARDSRTGFVSTNSVTATLVTRPRPTASGSYSTNICNGETAVLNASLSGLGPNWNNLVWSDGTNETATSANWMRTVFATEITNLFDNCPTNYVFTITNLFDQDTNTIGYPTGTALYTNQPGDLISTNIVTVNPRPKAAVVGTNTVCNGQPFTFTVLLSGQAPWTVQLSDGSILNVTSDFVTNHTCIGWAAATNVTRIPADPLDNCAVTTNYSVVNVMDNSGCSTGSSSDITGTAQATVNPRPKVAVLGTNAVCNGQPFTFTVLLSGKAPWTVPLSDGSVLSVPITFVTNISCLGWAAATNVTRFPTNLLDNCSVATNYFALGVTDLVCTAISSDVHGSAEATVNPRPKVAVLGTNTVCNGQPFTFTVLLSGQAPWTVQLSDNSTLTVKSGLVTNGSCSGWAAATNVTRFPTNGQLNAIATTNYSVVNVTDTASGCTNDPNDIAGTAQATVNPRPTATLISTNLPNYLFRTTNCNDGMTNYTITNVLTGFGPWTITWSSNGQQVFQYATNTLNGGVGPYTNQFTVYPTNALGPNLAASNIYYISNITDANSCTNSQSGDLLGTNIVVVNPIPSLSFSIGTNDFFASSSSHPNRQLVLNVTSNASTGDLFVQTSFPKPTETLRITNHVQLTGPAPLNELVIWQEVGADASELNPQTVYFTNLYTTANARSVISNLLYNTTPGTNFTIAAILCSNINTTCFVPLTNSIQVFINASNSASVGIYNQDTNQISICGDGSQPALIEVDLGGSPPWTVRWNDGTTNKVPDLTSLPLIRTNFLTNTTLLPFTNVYWVTNVADLYSTNGFMSNDTGTATIVVDPIDTNPPISLGNVTNCSDVAVPLSVTVPAGFTADWYADPTMMTNLAFSTTVYVPPVTNTASTNIYYVFARFNDPNLTNSCVSPYTNITLVSTLCTNQISSITLSGTNAVIRWSGDYILLQSSNLIPGYWTYVTQGVPGLNLFTNPITPPPPNDFFRLFAPTNYPYPTNYGP